MGSKYAGKKLSAEEAKAFVDDLYRRVGERWEKKVMRSEFMVRLGKGELPMSTIRIFFKNWGAYTIEVNTAIAASYLKHLTFFKRQRDLMGPFGLKIADEFIHPKPPGHYLVMMQTAAAMGIKEEEVFLEPMLPKFRGKIDFFRTLLYEGTIAEFWSASSGEEVIGLWSGAWFDALTKRYGFTPEQAIYFSTHHEADLKEHEGGVMGHGQFNRIVLQRLLESGEVDERNGYGMEYCAFTFVDLHSALQEAALEAARELG